MTLRRQGRSLRQIKQILGPMSNVTLHDALRGVPPPDWTVRPNAKDEQRARARELRAQGMDYEEIATALGVSTRTIESHRNHIMHKMRFTNYSDMIRFAIRAGLIAP